MVFKNRMLRRIFGPKREEVAGGCRGLHDELHNLYTSHSIIRVIKSRMMRWAGHVAQLGKMLTKFWSENLKGRDHSEDIGVGGRIILEGVLEIQGGKVWTGFNRIRMGTSCKFL
jgi:hypothetical protein